MVVCQSKKFSKIVWRTTIENTVILFILGINFFIFFATKKILIRQIWIRFYLKKKYNYYVLKQEKKNKLFIIELYKFITKSSLIYIFKFYIY